MKKLLFCTLYILFCVVCNAIDYSFVQKQRLTEVERIKLCLSIKNISPDASAKEYTTMARTFNEHGLTPQDCGLYILDKKLNKALSKVQEATKISSNEVSQIAQKAQSYVRRSSARQINVTIDKIDYPLDEYMLNTMRDVLRFREINHTPLQNSSTLYASEIVEIASASPSFAISSKGLLHKSSSKCMCKQERANNQELLRCSIRVEKHPDQKVMKGLFNHEFGHYYSGDGLFEEFFKSRFPKLDFEGWVKNYLMYANQYRADWLLGLIAVSNAVEQFEYVEHALKTLSIDYRYPLNRSSTRQPTLIKRIAWLRRWANLIKAYQKIN